MEHSCLIAGQAQLNLRFVHGQTVAVEPLLHGVARHASLEQRIYESKNSYYEALRASQLGWHESQHDVWPWTLYLLRIVDDAYTDFEARVVAARELTGKTKVEQVRHYVLEQASEEFRFIDIIAALPDISPAAAAPRRGLPSDSNPT